MTSLAWESQPVFLSVATADTEDVTEEQHLIPTSTVSPHHQTPDNQGNSLRLPKDFRSIGLKGVPLSAEAESKGYSFVKSVFWLFYTVSLWVNGCTINT